MIPREQAEATFWQRYGAEGWKFAPEVRHLQLEEVAITDIDDFDDGEHSHFGVVEVAPRVWLCVFECRYKQLDLGEWTGAYTPWQSATCVIIEALPGPYLID